MGMQMTTQLFRRIFKWTRLAAGRVGWAKWGREEDDKDAKDVLVTWDGIGPFSVSVSLAAWISWQIGQSSPLQSWPVSTRMTAVEANMHKRRDVASSQQAKQCCFVRRKVMVVKRGNQNQWIGHRKRQIGFRYAFPPSPWTANAYIHNIIIIWEIVWNIAFLGFAPNHCLMVLIPKIFLEKR